jgi:hypothetical protein
MYYRPFLLLLGLISCETHPLPFSERNDEYTLVALNDDERAYQAALAAARTRPAYPVVGFGLRLGMNSGQVSQHLDSLRQHRELGWPLPTWQLRREVWPDFEHDRLVRLFLCRDGTNTNLPTTREYLDVVHGLEHLYGLGYPHGEAPVTCSWFKGGTEVQLINLHEYGYYLCYFDLHHPIYINPHPHYSL